MGNAKKVPDSRMPRRLIAIRTSTADEANSTSWSLRKGMADAAYCAADEIDTATVST